MGKVFKALAKAIPEPEILAPELQVVEREVCHQSLARSFSREIVSDQPAASPKSYPAIEAARPRQTIAPHGPSLFKDLDDDERNGSLQNWNDKLLLFTKLPKIAESFRQIRTKILHPPDGRVIKNILVTSAGREAAGKSLASANIAYTLAQGIENHALLVDCDLRRSSLANLFGVDNQMGLADHLLNNVPIESLIKKTGLRKLSLLPSGPRPINPSELIGSKKMEEMMQELINRYQDRFLVLDSPPLLAASETAVLSKYVDGVILIVRWGRSNKEQVKNLVRDIGKDKIIGVVFNAFEASIFDTKVSGYTC